MPKFTKVEAELETTIEKWCYFLKHTGHLEVIPEKLNNEPFRQAHALANRANMTKEEWEAYDAAAVKMQDERGIATAAEKKGRQEGKQEHNLEIARLMRQKGLDTNLIAEMTGLLVEAMERL